MYNAFSSLFQAWYWLSFEGQLSDVVTLLNGVSPVSVSGVTDLVADLG